MAIYRNTYTWDTLADLQVTLDMDDIILNHAQISPNGYKLILPGIDMIGPGYSVIFHDPSGYISQTDGVDVSTFEVNQNISRINGLNTLTTVTIPYRSYMITYLGSGQWSLTPATFPPTAAETASLWSLSAPLQNTTYRLQLAYDTNTGWSYTAQAEA